MILKTLLSNRVFLMPLKKYNQSLGLLFFSIQYRNCNSNVMLDSKIFESVQIQKYLNFISNKNAEKNKFISDGYEHIMTLIEDKKNLEDKIKNLENFTSDGDKELEELIDSEKEEHLETIEKIKSKILNYLIQNNEEHYNRSAELKILPGIGGEESKLFMKELFNMYRNYAVFKNWELESVDDSKHFSLIINGDLVYGHLKCEAGVHRVQRVPETEKTGRTHTSTCSVVVLPVPKPFEIQIPEHDILVQKIKSSGPGGQNVNKRETCIRIKHIPSGITVESQSERFQFDNMKIAMKKLMTILFQKEQEKLLSLRKAIKKEQVGSNDYSDKVRTYHFTQNRVTDHRINCSSQNLKGFLLGNKELDYFISQVMELNRKKDLFLYLDNIFQSVEYKNFEKKQNN